MVSEEDIKELRKIQVRLLDDFKAVCDKNNLIYWLDFGALLGAVRQKGFIPWDDDVDVSMPMADYKKFLKIAPTNLPPSLFLHIPGENKAYTQNFAKLCDRSSTFLHPAETEGGEIHQGIYMDIFPSANYPKMPHFLRKGLLYLTGRSWGNIVVNKKNIWLNYIIYAFCKLIWFLFSPFKSDKVAQIVEDNWYYYAIPQTYIYPLKEIEFEGKFYPAPNKTHEYLSLMYGKNYITPPPPEKRVFSCKAIFFNTPCKFEKELAAKKS
jgi:lipopolysaccharide cholinephosphotransferase